MKTTIGIILCFAPLSLLAQSRGGSSGGSVNSTNAEYLAGKAAGKYLGTSDNSAASHNGAGLTNVNADTLGGTSAAAFPTRSETITVIVSNGWYVVDSGGTNWVFNGGIRHRDLIPMRWYNVGTGASVDYTSSNGVPQLAQASDKSTNFIQFICELPSDVDPAVSPVFHFQGVKTGTAGNVPFEITFANYINGSAWIGSPGTAVLTTNAFTGVGSKTWNYAIPTGWLSVTNIVLVQLARDGLNASNTLTGNLKIPLASLEVTRIQ